MAGDKSHMLRNTALVSTILYCKILVFITSCFKLKYNSFITLFKTIKQLLRFLFDKFDVI